MAIEPIMAWRKSFKALLLPVVCFITGLLIAGLVVTICYERQAGSDYVNQTRLHTDLYKQASCNTSGCHKTRVKK